MQIFNKVPRGSKNGIPTLNNFLPTSPSAIDNNDSKQQITFIDYPKLKQNTENFVHHPIQLPFHQHACCLNYQKMKQ